jgi:hypothetical protein
MAAWISTKPTATVVPSLTLTALGQKPTQNPSQSSLLSQNVSLKQKRTSSKSKIYNREKSNAGVLSGYLLKQNPNALLKDLGSAFKKRWFSVTDKVLYYFENQDSSSSKGFIDLTFVLEIKVIDDNKQRHRDTMFELITPGRVYVLVAESNADRKRWVDGLRSIKASPHVSSDTPEVIARA